VPLSIKLLLDGSRALNYFLSIKDMALPSNVAFKIEKETTKKQYFFLQTHFDNPEKSEGVVLSFGLRALYTDKPR